MNYLVTGATGFIGRHLCAELKARGHLVTAFGRRSSEGPWDRFIEGDLTQDVSNVVSFEGLDGIFHLAGKAHALEERPGEAAGYFEVIEQGTRKLVELAASVGIQRFVLMSTVKANSSAVGEAEFWRQDIVRSLTERDVFEPDTPYGQAKLAAEELVLKAGFGQAVALRPCLVYGPGNKGNLAAMVAAIQKGRFPPLPDTGNRRSIIHVNDVVQACCLAMDTAEANGGVYQITDGEGYSTRELYDIIRRALGKSSTSLAVPMWFLKFAALGGDVSGKVLRRRMPLDSEALRKLTGSAWYSCDQAKAALGYEPTRTFEEGVKDLL